ncbi:MULTISPECIES: hypothetical protein [Microbacterium]|nr:MULTISPECIES: hypothetical protein [Microbacterium]AMG84646.1 hypothetical protein AXH82_15515 [Microbacterium sp. PAMC 28756]QXE28527.1 hypothetical protein IZR02_08875 [Microbacterium paraoxydans]
MTFKPTHASASPSGLYGFVTDAYRPIPDELCFMLGRLDGETKFTCSIWRAENPEKGFVTPEDLTGSFIQAAGSADGITVEVRLLGPDGKSHLYTIGRPEPVDGTTTLIPISQTRAVRVFSNEVFTADEAAVIFYTYYLTDAVAQPYVLRELDLSQELSEQR